MDGDIIEATPSEALVHRCSQCDKTYKSRSGLSKHLKICKAAPADLSTAASNTPVHTPTSPAHTSPRDSPSIVESSQPANYQCTTCPRVFASKSSLAKHAKNCVESLRRRCRHCEATFNSFAGLRTHESRTHRDEEAALAGEQVEKTSQEIFLELARAEAALSPGRPLYNSLMTATGLSRDQIRHRREKPLYRELLEIATAELTKQRLETPSSEPVATQSVGMNRDLINETEAGRDGPTTSIILVDSAASLHIWHSPDDHATRLRIPQVIVDPPTPTADDRDVIQTTGSSHYRTAEHSLPGLSHEHNDPVPAPLSPELFTPPTLSQAPSDNDPMAGPSDSMDNDQRFPDVADQPVPPAPQPTLELIQYLQVTREHLTATDSNRPITQLIDRLIDSPREHYEELIEQWLLATLPTMNRRRGRHQPNSTVIIQPANPQPPIATPRPRNYGARRTGNGPRAAAYKKAQDLYVKNKALLADLIFSGRSLTEPVLWPAVEATEAYFSRTFEEDSADDDAPITDPFTLSDSPGPITPEEVALAKLHWKKSAPGPDGVTIERLKQTSNGHLAIIFTVILYANLQPTRFKQSRTTLIFKKGERADPANWRPITVSSAVQRLLHRILAKRLKAQCHLNMNQRGFVQMDGTMANVLILDSYLKTRAAAGRVSSIVGIDVTRAFDTVSHHSIRRGLMRAGIDPITKNYILSSLRDNKTCIRLGNQNTREFTFNRGVKQGDPISPLLFNMVLDEFVAVSNASRFGGTITNGTTISTLAFADDLLLIEDDPDRMTVSLDRARAFMEARGMKVNGRKCFSATTMRHRGALKPVNRSTYSIDGQNIPAVTDVNPAKYLGHNFNTSGIMKPNLIHLEGWLDNIYRAPLKPLQKLQLIKDHAIPKVMYFLQGPHTTAAQLKSADLLVKAAVKKSLHLHLHTPDAALYANIKDGGLGIAELRSVIPKITRSRVQNLRNHIEDTCLMAALDSTPITAFLDRITRLCRPTDQRTEWKAKLMDAPTLRGLEQSVQDPASYRWLSYPPYGWTGRDYVKAIHLRLNVLPTVGIPSNPIEQRRCRSGCNKVETLAHVIQQCPNTHWQRISRHNEIAKKIERHCRERWEVVAEPHVRHQDGTLFKPDLAITQGESIIVCDIGVNWEGTQSLEESHGNKKRVYDNAKFREAAARKWPNKNIIVEPIILGARGIWPEANQPAQDLLRITQAVKSSCVNSALKWGPSIHTYFMRSVWRRR